MLARRSVLRLLGLAPIAGPVAALVPAGSAAGIPSSAIEGPLRATARLIAMAGMEIPAENLDQMVRALPFGFPSQGRGAA